MNAGSEPAVFRRDIARHDGLRILHILRAPVGGLFRHVRDLATEQARRGHLVGIACCANASDGLTGERLAAMAPQLTLGLEKVSMARDIGWRDVTAYHALKAHAARVGFDVLHGHGAKGGAYARLLARALQRAGRPVIGVYTPHGGSLHYDPRSPKGAVYMALERRLARMSDAILFESAFSARRFEERVGIAGRRTAIVPNGLLAAEFEPVPPAADVADLLFVGELRHLKGVDVLLRAIAQVHRARPVRAVIVGEGPDRAAFLALADELGLTDAVSFPGAMPARRAFALGRAIVVPSRAESFPYIVLEAAAAGLALIATDVGGIPEIVAGTDTALVPAGDVDALAAAINAVIADPARAQERAARLRAAVEARFTVARMADAVLDLYAAARVGRA